MAKQTINIKKTSVSVKSKQSSGNLMKCNVCGGTGYQKKPTKKK